MASIPPIWIWLGIAVCIVQTGLFAGLNLAVFSLSQLRLQLDADGGDADAARVLELRQNTNQVLTTIIWGNVSTNVLLTLLSDSVLAGVGAFLFSTIAITLLGEIIPQAYFSRNALAMTARFLPFLNFYRVALYPLATPTALLLDAWLGKEGITWLAELERYAVAFTGYSQAGPGVSLTIAPLEIAVSALSTTRETSYDSGAV